MLASTGIRGIETSSSRMYFALSAQQEYVFLDTRVFVAYRIAIVEVLINAFVASAISIAANIVRKELLGDVYCVY